MKLEDIRDNKPCIDGWKKLTKTLGRTTGPVTLAEVYKSNGYNDALWCLRCVPFEEYKRWYFDVVETVLAISREAYLDDNGPRIALESAKSDTATGEDIDITAIGEIIDDASVTASGAAGLRIVENVFIKHFVAGK